MTRDVPGMLARHAHTASQANVTMTVPVADMLAILPVAQGSLLAVAVADAALDVQDAGRALSRAASSGETTKGGALTAAAQRNQNTTQPPLITRLQRAQQAHDDALNAYRKHARP